MLVCCVTKFDEIGTPHPGLIVFPEYANGLEIKKAAHEYPESVIVAAVKTGQRSRGLILHRALNRIEYLKVNTDGTTVGTGRLPKLPVYETDDLCVGVLICMDVQIPELVRELVARVSSSLSTYKIVCIPAHMGSNWFSGPTLDVNFGNVFVALCNHTQQDRPRCKSFIAGPHRTKTHEQLDTEPLHAELKLQ